jgi:protein-tyrosine-phosphatase
MPSLLFVCTANRCRSPIAEAIGRNVLTQRYPDGVWFISSAGTWAQNDLPPITAAQQVMKAHEYDISAIRSRIVTRDILNSSDLVLTMEANQKEALQVEFPEVKDRIHLLSEMTGGKFDVVDPVGLPAEEMEKTVVMIEDLIHRGAKKIFDLSMGE